MSKELQADVNSVIKQLREETERLNKEPFWQPFAIALCLMGVGGCFSAILIYFS